jgi:O-antigen ligase
MGHLLQRFGGVVPAVVALALPILWIPIASDSYILPRASIVIAGACLGTGLALLISNVPRLGGLRWPLLAAAAAALLAFVFSVSWPLSLVGSYTRYESLPIRLSYLGLLASAVWLLRTQRWRDAVVAAFVFGTAVASIQALVQAFSHAPFRPDGNLGNANLFAALCVMAIPLAIERGLRGTWFVGAWSAALVLIGAGLLVTTSRSGYFGAGVACLVLLTLTVPRRLMPIAGVFSAALVALALVLILASPLRTLNDDPPQLRLHLWSDGLRMVAARPLTGWGEDATGLSFGHFLSQDYATSVTFDRIHSGPLDVAATQGILGLAATGWVLVVLFLRAWRNRHEPGVAGLSAALAGYTAWVAFNFDWAPATGMFWLLAGTLWAGVSPLPSGERVRGEGTWRAITAVVLVLAAVAFAALPILADVWYLKGRAELSVRVDPLQAQYHWAIGTVAELRRAADLGETEPGMYVQLGDQEAQLGNLAQARRDYRRALEIDPYYSPASQRLGGAVTTRRRLRDTRRGGGRSARRPGSPAGPTAASGSGRSCAARCRSRSP